MKHPKKRNPYGKTRSRHVKIGKKWYRTHKTKSGKTVLRRKFHHKGSPFA